MLFRSGRCELQRTSEKELVLKYKNFDFKPICTIAKSRKRFVNIPNHEEMWFKFLSFLVLSAEYEENGLEAEKFLKVASKRTANQICSKFNRLFYGSGNIILDVAGIEIGELVEFAKSGEPLV